MNECGLWRYSRRRLINPQIINSPLDKFTDNKSAAYQIQVELEGNFRVEKAPLYKSKRRLINPIFILVSQFWLPNR